MTEINYQIQWKAKERRSSLAKMVLAKEKTTVKWRPEG